MRQTPRAQRARVYEIVATMIAERTGETPIAVMLRMVRRAEALQRQRRQTWHRRRSS